MRQKKNIGAVLAPRSAPAGGKINPDFFDENFKFIQYLGDASGRREAKANEADFKDVEALHEPPSCWVSKKP
jgi:hypothetical protein